MAQGDIPINAAGNLTADPELRFTQSGAAVASFTVACTPRRKTDEGWEDGEATFLRCSVWRQQAENVAESLKKGDLVMVQGLLKQRSYTTAEGEKRTVMEVTVDNVGPSLKWKSVSLDRVRREQGGQQRQAPANDDPWANPPPSGGGFGGFNDEPPFAVSPSMWTLNV